MQGLAHCKLMYLQYSWRRGEAGKPASHMAEYGRKGGTGECRQRQTRWSSMLANPLHGFILSDSDVSSAGQWHTTATNYKGDGQGVIYQSDITQTLLICHQSKTSTDSTEMIV